jgi:Pin2-interacting protein X1
MTSQGWSEGQALGSKHITHHSGGGSNHKDENAARLAAAKVGTIFKDDTLGLGARLKSKDVEGQRTGMDAFMGLLGRLNAKDEKEVEILEKKEDQKKLERYANGRWGGMMFVPGGVLVGGEEFGTKKAAREAKAKQQLQDKQSEASADQTAASESESDADRAKRKEERRKRKEARRLRREAKAARRLARAERKSVSASASHANSDEEDKTAPRTVSRSSSQSKIRKAARESADSESTSSGSEAEPTDTQSTAKKRKRSLTSTPVLDLSSTPSPRTTPAPPRSGRQLLRGRNIEAKRRAFQDARGLDGIFMRAAA